MDDKFTLGAGGTTMSELSNSLSDALISQVEEPTTLGEFTYEPLNKDEIRLLELHPGSGNDALMCSLSAVKLGQQLFTAISYCWGSTQRTQELQCGWVTKAPPNSGHTLQVAVKMCGILKITTNLRNCLLALRDDEFYRTLWVDSVCINQEDVSEKTVQVRMMSSIYNHSMTTVVYLGESDEDTEPALECVQLLTTWEKNKLEKNIVHAMVHGASRSDWNLPPTDGGEDEEEPKGFLHFWNAFVRLLDRDWFKRIWVIQEIILSRECQVVCGGFWVPWGKIVDACNAVDTLDLYTYDHMRDRCYMVLAIERRRQGYITLRKQFRESGAVEQATTTDFFHLINLSSLQLWTRHCGATDPRDKVFALLNVCLNSQLGDPPPIDYGMSLAEVYVRSARDWYLSGPSKPLQFLGCVDNSLGLRDIPSWVPDWSRKWTGQPLIMQKINGAAMKERAVVVFPDIPSPFTLPLHLKVRGLPLMVIHETERLKMPAETWKTGRHSSMLNRFTGPYPTMIKSYHDAFISSVTPEVPKDFDLDGVERLHSYWRYERARLAGRAIRPVRLPPKDGKVAYGTVEIDAAIAKEMDKKTSLGRPYTQELLYNNLPFYYRSHAFVPQESLVEGKLFFISSNGFMGLVPEVARKGDRICLFFGEVAPVVLRPVEDGEKDVFLFVGECFVYGLMGGEALEDYPKGLVRDFVLE